jgi:hypothetical protein
VHRPEWVEQAIGWLLASLCAWQYCKRFSSKSQSHTLRSSRENLRTRRVSFFFDGIDPFYIFGYCALIYGYCKWWYLQLWTPAIHLLKWAVQCQANCEGKCKWWTFPNVCCYLEQPVTAIKFKFSLRYIIMVCDIGVPIPENIN